MSSLLGVIDSRSQGPPAYRNNTMSGPSVPPVTTVYPRQLPTCVGSQVPPTGSWPMGSYLDQTSTMYRPPLPSYTLPYQDIRQFPVSNVTVTGSAAPLPAPPPPNVQNQWPSHLQTGPGNYDPYGGGYESYADKNRRRDADYALKDLTFDGTDRSFDWEFFANRFLSAIRLAGDLWTPEQRRIKLISCLKGSAARCVTSFTDSTVEQLWEILQQRFSSVGQESTYELKLHKRQRDVARETPQSFLDEISFLCKHAFPRSSAYDLEMTIKKYFVLGHPVAYQNHLNASVNREKGTLSDLIQACRQYEQLELFRHTVTARKPGVKAVSYDPDNFGRTVAAVADASDPSGNDLFSDDGDEEAGVYLTKAKRRRSKTRTADLKAVTEDQASQFVFSVDPYASYGYDEESGVNSLSEELENAFDEQLEYACWAIKAPRPDSRDSSFYRPQTPAGPRFRKPMICAYCKKMGHIFRYCRKLRADFPDGKFPPSVCQLIMNQLMSGAYAEQFIRRKRFPDDGKQGRTPQGVRAIEAPPPADSAETPVSGNG